MANGAKVSHGDAVLRLESAARQTEVLATVSGKLRLEVETGDTVSGGSRLAVIEPNAEQMVTALKALQKIGKSQDVLYVAEVEADPVQPSDIREQAKLAHQRIIERTK
jgi:pyruvate/2-oxoglutarate dehydrogenase complex dihydrolipoamide acyltransferase (E2) component